MDVLLVIVLACFGIGAGLFLGMGNHNGFLHALFPGLIGGALLAIPAWRDHDSRSAVILISCVVVGSLAAAALPDTNGLKQFCRNQKSLHIKVFSYELGRDPGQK